MGINHVSVKFSNDYQGYITFVSFITSTQQCNKPPHGGATYQMCGTIDEARVLPDGLAEDAEVLARELARALVNVDDAPHQLPLVPEGRTQLPALRLGVHLLHLLKDLRLLLLRYPAKAHRCSSKSIVLP